MANSVLVKTFGIILFIVGIGLLIIPYPAIREFINNSDLVKYNCSDARNFTYSGKILSAHRATALANMSIPDADSTKRVIIVKLRYPGIKTWLPYSFNTREDTVKWFSGISKTSSLENLNYKTETNISEWFQCVSDNDLVGGYTQPALNNLPLYYTSSAAGVILIFLSIYIFFVVSRNIIPNRNDYMPWN